LLVPDHVPRDVACGDRGVIAALAITGPAIEGVDARRSGLPLLAQSGSPEAIGLARVDQKRRAVSIDLPLAFAHDDRGRDAVGIHFNPVFAGLPQGKGDIRRIDLENLVRFEMTDADIQYPLRQLELSDLVVEIKHGYAGTSVHADHCSADLNLGPRARIRPQAVASRQRPIDRCLHPIVLTSGREADRARQVAEARYARWRVRASPAGEGQGEDTDHEGESPMAKGCFVHVASLRKCAP